MTTPATEEKDFDISSVVPAYLIAANTHDIAGSPTAPDKSEFGPMGVLSALGDFVSKGVPLAVGSGAAQLYNIVPTLGNVLGGEYEQIDYKAAVREFDDDLGKYYEAHQTGIDVAGFIASSFVPGMLGVKAFRGSQMFLDSAVGTGTFGRTMGYATGLLPTKEKYLAQAVREATRSGNPFSFQEANTLNAILSGVRQNLWEAAAFETAVVATMHNSPILKDMSREDMLWNGLMGVGLGGAIGGAIETLLIRSAVKGAATKADEALESWRVPEIPTNKLVSDSDAIIYYTHQRNAMPAPLIEGDLAARSEATYMKTLDDIDLRVRGHYQNMAKGDSVLAQAKFDEWKVSSRDNAATLDRNLDAVHISRPGFRSHYEAEIARIEKQITKKGLGSVTPEELAMWKDSRVIYIGIRGERMGARQADTPEILSIFDKQRVMKMEDVQLTNQGIKIGRQSFTHENNVQRPFNITGVDHYTVESRFVWAEMLPKWLPEDKAMVHAHDLPLLEKALRDGLEELRVIPKGGAVTETVTLTSRDQIVAHLIQAKQEVAEILRYGDATIHSLDSIVDKLKYSFGVNFNLVDDPTTYGFWTRVTGRHPDVNKGLTDLTGDVINMSPSEIVKNGRLKNTLRDMMYTVKHEEGHRTFQALLDTVGVGRQNLDFAVAMPKLHKELISMSQRSREWLWKLNDTKSKDYRNQMHELFADAFSYIAMNPDKAKYYPAFMQYFSKNVVPVSDEVMQQFLQRAVVPSNQEIAKIINVREHVLDGQVITDKANPRHLSQWFARDEFRADYKKLQAQAGTREGEQLTDPMMMPSTVKVFSVDRHTLNADGVDVGGMAGIQARVELYDQTAKETATEILGELLADGPRVIASVRHNDKTAGIASSANGNYGSTASWVQYVGQRTHAIIKKAKDAVHDTFTPHLSKLVQDTDAALEWSMLQEKLRFLPRRYKWNAEENVLVLVPKSEQEAAEFMARGIPEKIEIKSQLVKDLTVDHIGANGKNLMSLGMIRRDQGLMETRDPDIFYPIPRNSKNTPYFAIVIDDSVTDTGHFSMIYASDAKKLEEMINEIRNSPDFPSTWRIRSKAESEEWFKAHGTYSFERTLNDNHIDEFLAARGKAGSHLPVTDPTQIATDFLDWHLGRASNVVREAVSHRYARQFEELRSRAGEAMHLATSRKGYSAAEMAESATSSPELNLIKTALDIQKTADYPYWTAFNRMLDGALSKVLSKADEMRDAAIAGDKLEEIDKVLRSHGYQGPIVTEALYKAMNGTVPRGTLTALVNKANGLLATFTLRWDPINALNNTIGHSILYGTELQSITKAIQAGDSKIAGELAQLTKVKMPGMPDEMFTPGKLFANAVANFHSGTVKVPFATLKGTGLEAVGKALGDDLVEVPARAFYKAKGFITSISDQYDQTIDQIALSLAGKGKWQEVMTKMRGWGDKGEKLTGNRMAEEFNRFVAADTMRQLTDLAVRAKVMDADTAMTYINTFMNRTQGNFLASQRPMMFQGPIGQAIGLFQTYQFNLLQQLLRHIENGQGRTVATMAGLQMGVYGLNGMPAFNAINTHIIGNASGNTKHHDLYEATYSLAGKEAGAWLMYGFGANMFSLFHPELKTNLYTRGDINPRQLTLVPVNPADVPIVSATTKFLGTMKESFSKLSAGGDAWGTFISALEHNGVSRPLTGIAQTLGGMTRPDAKLVATSQQGSINMAHDVYSLTTMMRLAGARPLDEALVNDWRHRSDVYTAKDTARRNVLGEAVKDSILHGKPPEADQITTFQSEYAKAGGKQERFAQWMMGQYKNASNTQANQLRDALGSWKSHQLQTLMGGESLEDLGRK
jgi:hypothetical protein